MPEKPITIEKQISSVCIKPNDFGFLAHQWRIETPNGESSAASCKNCGEERSYFNYITKPRTFVKRQPAAYNLPPLEPPEHIDIHEVDIMKADYQLGGDQIA